MKNEHKIKEALKEHFETEYPYDPEAENKIFWRFTEEYHFEDKMDKLIDQQSRPYWKYINTAGKRVAIVIVFVAVLLSSAMTVRAFREPVIEFIVETYEKFSTIFVNTDIYDLHFDEVHNYIEDKYSLTELFGNYTLSESYSDKYSLQYIWYNSDQGYIYFYQTTSIIHLNINTERTYLHKFYLNGYEVYKFKQGDMNSYIWSKDGYVFLITLSDKFSNEQAKIVIESVEKVE